MRGPFCVFVVKHWVCPSGSEESTVRGALLGFCGGTPGLSLRDFSHRHKRAAVGITPGTTRAQSEYYDQPYSDQAAEQKMGNDREERSSESRIRELEGHREDS